MITMMTALFSHATKVISICLFLLTVTDWKAKNILILGILIYLIAMTISVLTWFFTTFYLEDDTFYYKRGILIKREDKIRLDKILGVDLEESLIQRLFGLKAVKIDIGATDQISDIRIILQTNKSIQLRQRLLSQKEEIEKIDSSTLIYHLGFKELIKFSLIKIGWFDVVLSLITLIFFTNEINLKETLMNLNLSITFVVLLALTLIVTIIKAIKISNEYFDFKVRKYDHLLEISSGFINRKVYSLNTEKTCSIKTTQNIFQRMTNQVTVSISALGYQDNKENNAIIFPSIDIERANDMMKHLFPHFSISKDEIFNIHPKYKLKHRYYHFGYNKNILYLKGGLLKKKTNIICLQSIEDILYKQYSFQKKYHIAKLKVNYKGRKIGDICAIKGVDTSHIKNLIDLISEDDRPA